jgi:hypothetical protein
LEEVMLKDENAIIMGGHDKITIQILVDRCDTLLFKYMDRVIDKKSLVGTNEKVAPVVPEQRLYHIGISEPLR